ncbi:MAG: hypothetical protein ACOYLB_10855 [Phototrophicaceae bacterium]
MSHPEIENDHVNEATEELDLQRVVVTGSVLFIAITLLIFVSAIILAVYTEDQFGSVIQVIRDIMIILVVLEGMLITLSLTILIIQMARLVNLLQSEIAPILKDSREVVAQTKGTLEFVNQNVTQPIITASSFMAGATTFIKELSKINQIINKKP